MRATAEQYGAIRGPNRRRVPQRRGYGLAFCLNVGIVFDAACARDSVALYANLLPSRAILGFLYANQVEKPEGRREEKSKPLVSSLRPRRQSRVDQRKRNAARVCLGSEIGPNLCLNKNDPGWTNGRKRASHYWPVIKRCVHDFHPGWGVLVGEGESGCGGRCQNAVQVGLERPQCVSEFQRNINFSYTDCLQPCRSLSRQPETQPLLVNSQPLP